MKYIKFVWFKKERNHEENETQVLLQKYSHSPKKIFGRLSVNYQSRVMYVYFALMARTHLIDNITKTRITPIIGKITSPKYIVGVHK
jgi:hypothetical protein